ncbi:MAG: nitrogen regulation protein NR(II) [Candidatus Binatia bacterium]
MVECSTCPEKELQALKGLVAWFYQSSVRLTEEYQRLEEQIARLNGELEKKNRTLEQSLRAREKVTDSLLSVLESLKTGVLVVDQKLTPTFFNRRLPGVVGSIDAMRVRQVLGEELVRRLSDGKEADLPLECERLVCGPDSSTLSVHITICEFFIEDKEPAGYILVFQDISRAKRLEAEVARARRLAALGEMAAGITHEVRSPLGGIELYASLIQEQNAGEAKRLATEILHAVHRLQTTISRLLSFATEPRVAAAGFPVSLLLRDVSEAIAPLLHAGKWKLELRMERNLPSLWGDRALLTQALANLVINATEAMPNGGVVSVWVQSVILPSATDRVQREIEIRVVDEGEGIAPANRERIFDPFFTTKRQGTGLGLALTRKIISAHDGSIAVSSTPRQGSCFTVFLPVASECSGSRVFVDNSYDAISERVEENTNAETNCCS